MGSSYIMQTFFCTNGFFYPQRASQVYPEMPYPEPLNLKKTLHEACKNQGSLFRRPHNKDNSVPRHGVC